MSVHDPRQVVEDLRSHLAAGDRRLAFLFGAGTSSAVNIAPLPVAGELPTHEPLIPGVVALTAKCKTDVCAHGAPYAAAWASLEAQCAAGGGPANVEGILSKLRLKIEAVGVGEVLSGLTREQLVEVESTVCATIAREVNPDDEKIPSQSPHDIFAAWVKKVNRVEPLEIFTTNYDTLFERSLEAAHLPVFDGFVGVHQPFFYPECLEDEGMLPPSRWVRLWKVHGSVNWRKCARGAGTVITRDKATGRGEFILPSHLKYDESRKQPYTAYIDRLTRVMNHDHSLLCTCGYSFGDEHINAVLYGALDSRSTANVIALVFGDIALSDRLVQAAVRRSNLTVLARNGGVVSGIFGEWKLTKPVDDRTHAFMDLAFDSGASGDDTGSPAGAAASLQGRMRLGDFVWMTRFLADMGGA